ncbi:MAG: hypothetical protein B6240_13325 [Desulfobacteraceae bacterium 4572_87]|nr:MAG: hypothetical protein B6240_13325 [Desulfobacteraceae bacterium 4572_87]
MFRIRYTIFPVIAKRIIVSVFLIVIKNHPGAGRCRKSYEDFLYLHKRYVRKVLRSNHIAVSRMML